MLGVDIRAQQPVIEYAQRAAYENVALETLLSASRYWKCSSFLDGS